MMISFLYSNLCFEIMKKYKFLILAGIGIILIGGLFLIWQKREKQGLKDIQTPIRSESEQKQETSADIVARNLDTSKWKTYRNDEYRFEFRYPEEMFEIFLEGNDDGSDKNVPKRFVLTLNLFFNTGNNTARTPILSVFFNEPEDDYAAAVNAGAKCTEVLVDARKGRLCSNGVVFSEALRNYESFRSKGICADNSIDSSLVIELASKNAGTKRYTDGISIDLHCDHKESLGIIYQSIYDSLRFF